MKNRLGSKDPLSLSEAVHPENAYDTPASLAVEVACLARQFCLDQHIQYPRVLDPGSGDFGVFGWAVRRCFNSIPTVHGLDIRDVPRRDWYDRQDQIDFMSAKNNGVVRQYDVILGNPPFRHAEAFVRKAVELVSPSGIILFLFRMAWATTSGRTKENGIHRTHPFWVQYNLPKRPGWWLYKRPPTRGENESKHTNTVDYSIFLYRKQPGPPRPQIDWLVWDMDEEIEVRFRKEARLDI